MVSTLTSLSINDGSVFVPAAWHNEIVYRVGPVGQEDYLLEYRNRFIDSVNFKGTSIFPPGF